MGSKLYRARKAACQGEFIYLTEGMHARCWEHYNAQTLCVIVPFEVAGVYSWQVGGRAHADPLGCLPGSLQTVFSNCEVGVSGIHSFQVRTLRLRGIKQLV